MGAVSSFAAIGLRPPMQLTSSQLAAFTVGLIDGAGSLQVNHCKGKNLQYRLVIKLKYTAANHAMLLKIAAVYLGSVHVHGPSNDPKFVMWVINDRAVLEAYILPLFAAYPPLTTRVTLQLAFMLKAMGGLTLKDYFATRALKFNARASIAPLSALPPYFNA